VDVTDTDALRQRCAIKIRAICVPWPTARRTRRRIDIG